MLSQKQELEVKQQWLQTSTETLRYVDDDHTVILFKSKSGFWGHQIFERGGGFFKGNTFLEKQSNAQIIALRHLRKIKARFYGYE